MAEAIKIRTQINGDLADIRILLQHPMETGQRRDDKGMTIAPHFIQLFSVSLNGRPLIDGQLNTAVSRNPLFAFKARGIKTGDRLSVTWTDSRGDSRKDEHLVP